MKKLVGEKHQVILKLNDGIEIRVNPLNWILFIPPRETYYFSGLDILLVDLFDQKLKINSLNIDMKDFKDLSEVIYKTRVEILEIMKDLTSFKNNV